MCSPSGPSRYFLSIIAVFAFNALALAQKPAAGSEFGPVMTAYLGYLHNEQEVVDDRASRKEISVAYYRRNSNRIQALRQMAIRLVRQSENDYVPELEAVTVDELRTIFEYPPKPTMFRQNEVIASKFRYLGAIRSGDTFYLFARLDPYEQAELLQRDTKGKAALDNINPTGQRIGEASTRARRTAPK
jgi:hypothetical protein